ncbi:MAG: hypothetical protein M1831_002534 [Alyxoria varia]|nr:MAG: hypothetical protein M1831_002534 [Alyxoria varia]
MARLQSESTVELNDLSPDVRRTISQVEGTRDFEALPPADGGRRAWLVLAACFMVEALLWGFPYSFGLFEKYYTTHEPFSKDPSGIAAIGTTATGIMYFGSPVVSSILQKWPRLRRSFCVLGLSVVVLSLVAASFSQSIAHLILTQGVLYGIGGAILYFPAILFLDEWFVRRKGLAYGIMWGGTGASGVIIPFLLQWLLSDYGFRTALRIWAIIMFVLTSPALIWLKPRLPVPRDARPRPNDLTFLRTPAFWVLQTGNVILNLGFFIPSIYIPSYASTIHLSSITGTGAISAFNAATLCGAIGSGALIDYLHVTTVILISALGSGVAVLLFWGFATSSGMLYTFALLFGLFAGGFSATWSGCAEALRRKLNHGDRGVHGNAVSAADVVGVNVETGMVIAVLGAGKGIGAVVSGPLSEKLLRGAGAGGFAGARGAYGTRYGGLITFTGVTACLGGVSWLGRRIGLI